MADAEWLSQTPVGILLRELAHAADSRRLQQFACACCRRVQQLIRDDRSRRALDTAERYAAGQASDEELLAAQDESKYINYGEALAAYAMAEPHALAAYAVYLATKVKNAEDASYVADVCAAALNDDDEEWLEDEPPPPTAEEEFQMQLARQMFPPAQ